MATKTKKDKAIFVYIPIGQHKRLKDEAKKRGLSISAFIRLMIGNWFDGIRFERRESETLTK